MADILAIGKRARFSAGSAKTLEKPDVDNAQEIVAAVEKRIEEALRRGVDDMVRRLALEAIPARISDRVRELALSRAARIGPSLCALCYFGHSAHPVTGVYRPAAATGLRSLIHHSPRFPNTAHHSPPPISTADENGWNVPAGGAREPWRFDACLREITGAMLVQEFLGFDERPRPKQRAAQLLMESGIHAGSGGLLALANESTALKDISLSQIYRLYDLETASNAVAGPLAAGAALGGADELRIKRIFAAGILIGRALRIRHDILEMFGALPESEHARSMQSIGVSVLVWFAYRHGGAVIRKRIDQAVQAVWYSRESFEMVRDSVLETGSRAFAYEEIQRLYDNSGLDDLSGECRSPYGAALRWYIQKLLDISRFSASPRSPATWTTSG